MTVFPVSKMSKVAQKALRGIIKRVKALCTHQLCDSFYVCYVTATEKNSPQIFVNIMLGFGLASVQPSKIHEQ